MKQFCVNVQSLRYATPKAAACAPSMTVPFLSTMKQQWEGRIPKNGAAMFISTG